MSYVIYHKDTTRTHYVSTPHRGVGTTKSSWATERAAKSARTKAGLDPEVWLIAPSDVFRLKIEKKRKVKNLLNPDGPWIEIPVNTPAHLDPSTETYHCM